MSNDTSDSRAKILAVGAVLCWSTVATAFKLGLEGLSPISFLFYVIISSIIFLCVFITLTDRWKGFKNIKFSDFLVAVLSGLLNPFAYYLILFEAYDRLPAQVAQTLNYTWPIVLVLMSAFINKRKVAKNVIWGLLLGFLGVMFIASRGHIFVLSFDGVGVFLAVFSSLVWATYWIISKSSKVEPVRFLFINQVVGLLATLLWITVFDIRIDIPNTQSALATIYSGWFEMGIAFVLWITALRYASKPEIISHFIFFAPFLSLFFIRFILSEPIMFSTLVGLVLIISGVLIVEYGSDVFKKIRKKLSI